MLEQQLAAQVRQHQGVTMHQQQLQQQQQQQQHSRLGTSWQRYDSSSDCSVHARLDT
jgi:hypothetical protein